jgi:hypothetical protein
LGHALALVEMIGQHVRMPDVHFVQLWNTRWVMNNYKDPPEIYDALSRTGAYFPIGRANAIWGQYLLDRLVSSTDTPMIRSFASVSEDLSKANVILINKDTSARDVSVALAGLGSISSVKRYVFSGAGPTDLAPVWTETTSTAYSGSTARFTMEPVSVTVLSVESRNAPPVAVSASPTSGSGSVASLALTWSDANGFDDIASAYALIGASADSRSACYVIYYRSANTVYLLTDDGKTLLGPLTPGRAGTVRNSQCTITGSNISAVGSGNNLTLNVSFTFAAGFTGQKNVYLTAQDTSGTWAAWSQRATWNTDSTTGNRPPTSVSVTPALGAGTTQTFAFTFADPDGVAELTQVYALINDTSNARNSCYLYYVPQSNSLYLMSDNGATSTGPVRPGTAGTLQNSQCVVDSAGSWRSTAGSNLTLNARVTFRPSFAGIRNIYLAAQDITGSFAGLTSRGTWVVR